MDERNELKNRYLHIDNIQKPDIHFTKPDIEEEKTDFDILLEKGNPKTVRNAAKLYREIGSDVFGRGDVVRLLGLKNSAASELIRKLIENGLIVSVKGLGKGRYKFK